jgi:hypothetical protein
MKKSELKEIIRTSLLNEYGEDYERESRRIEYGINPEMPDSSFTDDPEENYGDPKYWASLSSDEEDLDGMFDIEEAKKDKKEDKEEETDEEEDISVDVEGDIELEEPEPELDGEKGDIQSNLQSALDAAKQLGDQKLIDQIGNTITFYTRTHIVGDAEGVEEDLDLNESVNRFKKLAGN